MKLLLTRHARERMAERGIRVKAIRAAIKFGRRLDHPDGCSTYWICHGSVPRKALPFRGTFVVVDAVGRVATVYLKPVDRIAGERIDLRPRTEGGAP